MSKKKTGQNKALLYVRVSTGKQANGGYSLSSQARVLKKAAQERGYEFEVVTETGSGRNSSRPALAFALKRLRSGEAQALFALDIDRLARSTLHLLQIASQSETEGWDLFITSSDVDTATPAGEMFFTLAAAFAQYESRMISARVKRQHQERRDRGAVWGLTEGPITPQPAYVIDTILNGRLAGESFSSLARKLRDEGVPTARGGIWHPATVRGIWQSPKMNQILKERGQPTQIVKRE